MAKNNRHIINKGSSVISGSTSATKTQKQHLQSLNSTTSKTPAIECSHMNYSIGKTDVLLDVTFSIAKGSSVAIVGPNGGGKSTLLSLMLGLLIPKNGTLKLLGGNPKQNCQATSSLFQHHKLKANFPITVREVVKLGLYGSSLSKNEKTVQVQKALQEAKLLHIAENRLDELSGGQRQRTYLARTWISESEVYFFDEPTSFLDDEAENFFYEKIVSLKKQKKTTVIISHDLSALPIFADGLLCVNQRVHMLNKNDLLKEETRMKTLQQLYGSPHLIINPHTHK